MEYTNIVRIDLKIISEIFNKIINLNLNKNIIFIKK